MRLLVQKLTLFFTAALIVFSCQQADGQYRLSPKDFAQKFNELKGTQLLDVRTPQEYAGGSLKGAINIDYNAGQLDSYTAKLNPKEPVFIYCAVGGRSSSGAKELRSKGFTVYELSGGIRQWQDDQLPLDITKAAGATAGSTNVSNNAGTDLKSKLNASEYVLVDFYAPWCKPCKQMAPDIEKLDNELKNLTVVKINTDEERALVKEYKIEEVPTILLFKKGKLVNRLIGLQTYNQLKSNLN